MTDHEMHVRWLKSDVHAIAMMQILYRIFHLCDDIADGDKPLAKGDVLNGFWATLIELPRNIFYRHNFADLNPVMAVAIQNWFAANHFEESDTAPGKRIAFILRSDYINILTASTLLIGGPAWTREVAPEIRTWVHAEGFDAYLKNLDLQHTTAHENKTEGSQLCLA